MSSIITITFNPALDKTVTVPVLIPEKKLKCSEPVVHPGGGGVNVARAIKKLGGTATAIYMAGGYTGKAFTELLNQEGIIAIATQIKGSTRENIILLDTSTNKQYRLGMPGPTILEDEWQQCIALLANALDPGFIIVSGALAPGMPTSVYSEIAFIAESKKAKLIVDTSGDSLKAAVNAGLYLIKPNLAELSALADEDKSTIEKAGYAAVEIIKSGRCEVVVVSMAAAGAMLVTKDLTMHIPPPSVKIKSTVGAGDSMVAGIVLSLAQNKTIEEAAQYGVACGTAATMNPGTQLCFKDDADYLFSLINPSAQVIL